MTKFFAVAALTFGLLVNSPALAAEKLTHNGITYEYVVTTKGKTRVIEGYNTTNNRPFRLVVSGGRVDGVVQGAPVSFRLRDVKPVVGTDSAATTIATR